jgi:hypothetical protein
MVVACRRIGCLISRSPTRFDADAEVDAEVDGQVGV